MRLLYNVVILMTNKPKNMSKRKEFENKLDRITNIYFLAQESYLVLRELYANIGNSPYLIGLKNESPFINLTRVNYWRIIVLQLTKLYLERGTECFNLPRLLEQCKSGHYFRSLLINQDFIHSQLQKIDEKQGYIEHLKNQRDKVFAHEDKSSINISNDLTLDETKELLDLCQNIIVYFYSEVFGMPRNLEVSNSPVKGLRYILKSLDERQIQRDIDMKKHVEELIKAANKK